MPERRTITDFVDDTGAGNNEKSEIILKAKDNNALAKIGKTIRNKRLQLGNEKAVVDGN